MPGAVNQRRLALAPFDDEAALLVAADGAFIIGEDAKADAIMAALKTTLASGHVTPDLGGAASTTSLADAICRELSSSEASPR